MKWRETAILLGLQMPSWQAYALDYLESAGFVFCVDFGIDNAVDKARAHWSGRKRT